MQVQALVIIEVLIKVIAVQEWLQVQVLVIIKEQLKVVWEWLQVQVLVIIEGQIKVMLQCKLQHILLIVQLLIIQQWAAEVKLQFMGLPQILPQMQQVFKAIINRLMQLILLEEITMGCMALVQLQVINLLKTKKNKTECMKIYYKSL